MYSTVSVVILVTMAFLSMGCSQSKSGSSSDAAKNSYSFSASASANIALKSSVLGLAQSESQNEVSLLATGPTLCSSVVCFTPTSLTGKYYGTGFLIQSNGSGMTAYFGQSTWSDLTGKSESYSFNAAVPISNSGTLTCCNGTGDLTSENTYIESAIYLFGYLDATFTVSGVTSNTSMNREFTVRFVLADDAVTSAKRGDVLLKDPADGIFKYIDTAVSAGGMVGAGTLVEARPSSPVVMNTSVTNWTNPFGTDKGNQSIPVIYAPIITKKEGEVFQVKKTELETNGRTYTYGFDPTNFVMFPDFLTSDINSLYSYTQMLSKISLGGLPHSTQSMGIGNPAGTLLKIVEP